MLPQHAFLRGCLRKGACFFLLFLFNFFFIVYSLRRIIDEDPKPTPYRRVWLTLWEDRFRVSDRNPTPPKLCRFTRSWEGFFFFFPRTFVRFVGVFLLSTAHASPHYWLSQGQHGNFLPKRGVVCHTFCTWRSVSRENDYHLCSNPREIRGTTTRTGRFQTRSSGDSTRLSFVCLFFF